MLIPSCVLVCPWRKEDSGALWAGKGGHWEPWAASAGLDTPCCLGSLCLCLELPCLLLSPLAPGEDRKVGLRWTAKTWPLPGCGGGVGVIWGEPRTQWICFLKKLCNPT